MAVIGLCGTALSPAAEAGAQTGALESLADLPLEELPNIRIETVSGASGYEQPVTRAPASVSIVTADEIKKLGFRTLAEVLESIPGLYVTDDLNYSYLGVRGFNRRGIITPGCCCWWMATG